jgi:hypothetical protein
MDAIRRAATAALVTLLIPAACSLMTACSRPIPEQGPLTATSNTVDAAGEYHQLAIDAVERMTIDEGKLVFHGPSKSVSVDLPPNADASQRNRGWALVTEGEADNARSLTFTQEISLEDFTISVPPGDGQVVYGSLGARGGGDVLIFAYGSGDRAYWGAVTITKKG